MHKLVIILLVGLSACQFQSQLIDPAGGDFKQQSTTEFRPGNPKDRTPLTKAADGPVLRVGTDINEKFQNANAACPGSQMSAYLRFQLANEETIGEVSLTSSTGDEAIAARYRIPKSNHLFDFIELESLLAELKAKNPEATEVFDIRLTQKVVNLASADAGASETLVWQSEPQKIALIEPRFQFLMTKLDSTKKSRAKVLTLDNLAIEPQKKLSFESVYACYLQPERRLALRLTGVSRTAPAGNLVRYLPLRSRRLLLSTRTIDLSFDLYERDFESFAPRQTRGAVIQNVMTNNEMKELALTNQFGVDL